jgi:hypothetical protein
MPSNHRNGAIFCTSLSLRQIKRDLSPNSLNAIGIKDSIAADQRNLLRQRLGDEQSVKGVFMMATK